MSEMAMDYKMERSTEKTLTMVKTTFKSNCIDQRNNTETLTMVKGWIEKYIKPELKEHEVVVKRSDAAGRDGIMSQIYSLASRFGLNAKMSSTDGECMYSFWYPCGD